MTIKTFTRFLLLTVLSLSFFTVSFAGKKNQVFTQTQKQVLEKIIRDYIVNNPEVLVEASKSLRQRQQAEMMKQAEKIIAENPKQLFGDASPSAGNQKGKLVMVEFFDYQCGYCRKMIPIVHRLIKDNAELKVVFKQFPIFGESSLMAARAALAARNQGKFLKFHEVLMHVPPKLNEQKIMDAAKKVGLNIQQLKKDMNSKAVDAQLQKDIELASELGLRGTPAFIVANRDNPKKKPFFYPGAASIEVLQGFIEELRQ